MKLSAYALILTSILSCVAFAQEAQMPLPLPRPDNMPAAAVDEAQVLFPQSITADRFLRITTGPIRGGYYAVGGVLCHMLNQSIERHRIECLVRPSSGSGENIAHVLGGGAEMGLVQSDWLSFATTSAEANAGNDLDFAALRSVAGLYGLVAQVVVRDAIGAQSVSDLRDRRVGLSVEGSGQRQLAEVILAQSGLSLRNISAQSFGDDAEMARALCAGELDAYILVAPAPLEVVEVTLRSCGAQLLGLEGSVVEALVGDRDALSRFSLGATSYPSQRQTIASLGYVVTLVAGQSVEDRLVAEVARALLEGQESYALAYPALSSMAQADFFDGGFTAPIHDGVVRYLDTLAPNPETDSEQAGEDDIIIIVNDGGTGGS